MPNKGQIIRIERGTGSMKDERIVLHRDELYKQVWETPMMKLAKEYGLSDRGLAKICKRLNIPVPPRGYWAKVQNGIKVPKKKLPKRQYGSSVSWEIQKVQHEEEIEEILSDDSFIPERIKNAKKIIPPKRLTNPHPLVRQTKVAYEKCKPDKYGAISVWKKSTIDLRISPKSLNRALRIMNALIRAFEKYGYRSHRRPAAEKYRRSGEARQRQAPASKKTPA